MEPAGDRGSLGSLIGAGAPSSRLTGVGFRVGLGMANLGFYVASIGAVLVLLAPDLGLRVEQVAWLGPVFGYGLIAMAIAGPYLLRLGANRVLALAAASLGLGSVLLAFAASATFAYAGAILQGLGAAGLALVVPKFLHGQDAEAKLTRANAAASVAGVAAPVLIGLAAMSGLGGRLPLLLMAACMALLVVLALASGRDQLATEIVIADAQESVIADAQERLSRGTVIRRWLALVCAVAAEFSFVVWGVSRLIGTGLDAPSAAIVGAAFPIGMALGRVVGTPMIARFPMVAVGSCLMGIGTLMVVLTDTWPLVGAGQLVAGFGVATLYPITIARLMATPGLRPELGASLGVLGSGVAITVAPTVLAELAKVVDLRVAFLVPLPLLLGLLVLHGGRRPFGP